jgi:hypothetical protein
LRWSYLIDYQRPRFYVCEILKKHMLGGIFGTPAIYPFLPWKKNMIENKES